MPSGLAVSVRSGLMSITRMPAKEMMMPATVIILIFSLIMNQARKGLTTGMVAIMMALTDMTPMLAPSLTLLAFTIVIVGGLGSMTGALAGGLLIGVAEAVASLVVSPAIQRMVSFGLLVLVLALRPQGLFGKAES